MKLTEMEKAIETTNRMETYSLKSSNEQPPMDDKQLVELAKEIAHNAIEKALFEMESAEPENENSFNTTNEKNHCEDAITILNTAMENVSENYHKVLQKQDKMLDFDVGSNENKQNCGDMTSLASVVTQSALLYTSENIVRSSKVLWTDREPQKIPHDLHTTASQLSSDKDIPIITLTTPEGESVPISEVEVQQSALVVPENSSRHISAEYTGVSQDSLTRDDTLNSSSVSEQKIVGKSSCQFNDVEENKSEKTEDSGKDLCAKDDYSEKNSMLQDKVSDLSVSQASLGREMTLEEVKAYIASEKSILHSKTLTKAFLPTDLDAGECRGCTALHPNSNRAPVNQMTPDMEENEKRISPLSKKHAENIEEELLLAEAEAVFFAEMGNADTQISKDSLQQEEKQMLSDGDPATTFSKNDPIGLGDVDNDKPQKKYKPITTDWVSAKPFTPRKMSPPVPSPQGPPYDRQAHCEGSTHYSNNNNCHDRSQIKHHIMSAEGEHGGQDVREGVESFDLLGEDHSYEEVQDIIVLPDQQIKTSAQPPPLQEHHIRAPPRFRGPPPPRFHGPYHQQLPPMMQRPSYHSQNMYGSTRPPGCHNSPYPKPMPNQTHMPRPTAQPSAMPPRVPFLQSASRHLPPPQHPPPCSFSNELLFEKFDKVCNIRDALVPYKEIDGCCYFDPMYIADKPPAGVEFGYPQRGKRRKAVRLSSRFPTQAGKFHHHANFYVRNCAEAAMSNPHDAN